jgi:hypothetical protein
MHHVESLKYAFNGIWNPKLSLNLKQENENINKKEENIEWAETHTSRLNPTSPLELGPHSLLVSFSFSLKTTCHRALFLVPYLFFLFL